MFPLPVMSLVYLWALRPLPMLLQLCLLVQPAPIRYWAKNSDQLTSDSHPSYLPTESPNFRTPPSDSRGPYNLGSSAPSKTSAPSQELTRSVSPFLGTNSGQPSPKSKQFVVPHQDLPDKLILQEKLPESMPVQGGDYNQAGPPPHALKSKIQTIDLGQASDHQSFEILLAPADNQSSRTTPLFVSPGPLENDIPQHSRLATFIVGTEEQSTEPQPQKQPLQNYPELNNNDSLPHKSQENPSLPLELLEQLKSYKFQLETQTPERPEKIPFSESKKDIPAQQQHVNEGVVPSMHPVGKSSFPSRKEAHYSTLPNALINPVDIEGTTPRKQQTDAKPPERAKEKHASVHEEGLAQPSELHSDREHAETRLEVPGYPEKPLEEVIPPEIPAQLPESIMEKIVETLPHHEVTVHPPGHDQDYHHYFPNVKVEPLEVEVNIHSEPTKEAEHFLDHHKLPSQPLGPTLVAELSFHHQKQTAQPSQSPEEGEISGSFLASSIQPPEFNEDLPSLNHHDGPYEIFGPSLLNKPHFSEQGQAVHYSKFPQEVESSGSHLEDHAELEKPLEEIIHAAEHEALESHMEYTAETPVEVTKHPGQIQAHDDTLAHIKIKLEDKEVAITSEPTKETKTSIAQHDSSVKPHGFPMEVEYPISKEEQPTQHSESHGETETSESYLESSLHPSKVAEEFHPSLTQVEVPHQTLATETSLSEQEHPGQHSEFSQKVEHSGSHLEDEAHHEKYPEEVTHPAKQEAPVHAPESPVESVAEILAHDKATGQTPDQDRDYHDYFPSGKVKPENYHDNLDNFKVKPDNDHDNSDDLKVKSENDHGNSDKFKLKPDNNHNNLDDFKLKPENYHDNLGDFKAKSENDHDNWGDFKAKSENDHDNWGNFKVKPENHHDNLDDFKVKPDNDHYNLDDFKAKSENDHDNLDDFKVKPENYHDNLGDFKAKSKNDHENWGSFKAKSENEQNNWGGFKAKSNNYNKNWGDFKARSENDHDNWGDFKPKSENDHDNWDDFKVKAENHDNLLDFKVKPDNYHDKLDDFKVKPENYHDTLDDFKVKPENYHDNLGDFKAKSENDHENWGNFKVKPENHHDNLDDFKFKPENDHDNLDDFKAKSENDHNNVGDFKAKSENDHDNWGDFKAKSENDHDNWSDFKVKPENHDNFHDFKVKPDNFHDNFDDFNVQPEDKKVTVHSEPLKEIQTSVAQHEALAWPTGYVQEEEPVVSEQDQAAHHSEYPEKEHPSEIHPEAPAHASKHPKEFKPLIHQKQPALFSAHHELIASPPHLHEVQYSNILSVTVKHPYVGLPIKPEPTTGGDISSIYYEAPAYHSVPMNDRHISIAQHHEAPPLPPELFDEVEPIPIHHDAPALEVTADETPSTQQEPSAENIQTFEEIETPLIMQEAPTQLSEFPMDVELPSAENVGLAQLPKPHKTLVHAPGHFEIISGQDPVQHSALSGVTVPHLDVEINISPEPTRESEHSSTLKKAIIFLMNPEIPLPNPHQIPAHYRHPTQVTVQPFDLDLSLTPGSRMNIEPTPNIQDTKTELSTPLKKFRSQAVVFYVMPVSIPGHVRIQHTNPPKIPLPSLDLVLPSTPGPTAEAGHPPVLKKTAAVPPNQPKITFQTPVTAHPLHMELTISHRSANPATEKALAMHMDQIVFPSTNICELCSCQFQALVCVGLKPKHRLHQVPVPDPTAKMKIFTTLNFHGNAISYTNENTWKEYPWAEKIILSENHLTELRKDSFEGLLNVMVLDLSCNKIQSIERSTFEPLPFLKYLNLGCNLLTELSFGTFEAWHGMQFLHKLILSRNPLTTVEDIHLFKLPALKYLDMGRTQVQLTTVENILTMSLELEKLILPHQMAGCLCQYKNNIEVICKTVKLHCDSILLINISYCLEEESIGNPEGTFMKVLKVRKRNNSTELIIEPETEYLDKNDDSYSGFMNEQLEINYENEISNALNNILPYLSQNKLHDARATLLPFIKLLFSNEKNGNNHMDNTENNIRRPPPKPESSQNELNKLNFVENLLNAEIQKKIDEVKKKEEINMDTHPTTLLDPEFKRHIFPQKVHSAQPQENIQAEMQSTEERQQRPKRVPKRPKSIHKRHLKKVTKQSIWMKQSDQPLAKERFRRLPLRERHLAQEPKKLVGNSLPTESSFTKELRASTSSLLKPDSEGRASMSTIEKSLDEVRNRAKTLTYTKFVLDGANSRVKSIKDSNPSISSPPNYGVHKTGSVKRIRKAKRNRKFRKKTSLFRPVHANRPPFSGVRSLINSPSGEDFSSWGEPSSQKNIFPEFYGISNPVDITPPKLQITGALEGNTFVRNIPVPEESLPENTIHENLAAPGSSVTAFNLMPPVQQTSETLWEHLNLGIDSSVKSTDSQSKFSSFGDHLEIQLNQQLKPLVPNNDVRKLLSQLIRTLTIDCSENHMQKACSKLISRSGLLMKLLSRSQEVNLSKAGWDTDQWKTENYINESTEAQGERKELSELIQEVPGSGFNNKIILAVAVILVVMILIIIFCLIEICCHRRATVEGKGSSRGFCWFLRRQSSSEPESEEGLFSGRPFSLRDMYRSLSGTSKKSMAKKLHDKGKPKETAIKMPPSESESGVCCGICPSTKN